MADRATLLAVAAGGAVSWLVGRALDQVLVEETEDPGSNKDAQRRRQRRRRRRRQRRGGGA